MDSTGAGATRTVTERSQVIPDRGTPTRHRPGQVRHGALIRRKAQAQRLSTRGATLRGLRPEPRLVTGTRVGERAEATRATMRDPSLRRQRDTQPALSRPGRLTSPGGSRDRSLHTRCRMCLAFSRLLRARGIRRGQAPGEFRAHGQVAPQPILQALQMVARTSVKAQAARGAGPSTDYDDFGPTTA